MCLDLQCSLSCPLHPSVVPRSWLSLPSAGSVSVHPLSTVWPLCSVLAPPQQSCRLWCPSGFPLVSVLQLLSGTPGHRRAELTGVDSPGLERSIRGVMKAVNCSCVLIARSNIDCSCAEPMVVTGTFPGLW